MAPRRKTTQAVEPTVPAVTEYDDPGTMLAVTTFWATDPEGADRIIRKGDELPGDHWATAGRDELFSRQD